MRWHFPDPTDAVEQSERLAMLARIDAFWSVFQAGRADLLAAIRGTGGVDVGAFMREHLNDAVHPQVMWEFGPGVSGGHFLALSPESARRLGPLVDVILSRAPTFAEFSFVRGRPPKPFDMALRSAQARTGGVAACAVKEGGGV